MDKPDSIDAWLQELGKPSADRDYKPGHDRVKSLLAQIDLKKPLLRVRVAGTNGKGSTANMLAAALSACGMRVGLYTSPHIHRFNERIRVDGKAADDSRLLSGLERLMPIAQQCGVSYFEMATALALDCFSEANVDVEILEAGVGARLDATTAVPADMALITPIGLDHQAWLGDSVEQIATEKSYVGDGCRWIISAPQSQTVAKVLTDRRPEIVFVNMDTRLPALAAHGDFQRINAALAWQAALLLQQARLIRSDARVVDAIAETRVPCRMQLMELRGRRIWLDAGHNRHAVEAVVAACHSMGEHFDAILVFSREDRDLSQDLPLLRPICHRLVSGGAGNSETVDACYANFGAAISAEIGRKSSGNFLILGSFATVAAAQDWARRQL